MENYVYVLTEDGSPLMPTTRYGRVRRLLKEKKAEIKIKSAPMKGGK